jgi:hypothetical protein
MTAEMALVRTEVAGVSARVDLLRQDVRRGFTDMTQVLGQILARLPEGGPDVR